MQPRLDYSKLNPAGAKAMWGLENYVRNCGLEQSLLELVKFRASQINGCAYCIDMHWAEGLEAGESEVRLAQATAWHESPYFDDRERAALALTDSVTRVGETHVPDEVWREAEAHFDPDELANLLFAIAAINFWNRIAVSTRIPPQSFSP